MRINFTIEHQQGLTESLYIPEMCQFQYHSCSAIESYLDMDILSVVRLSVEGYIEKLSSDLYLLDNIEISEMSDEPGIPVGWFPLINGYSNIPTISS